MYALNLFIPVSHIEVVKKAIFQAGAGKYNAYEQCCWQTLGHGQFYSTNSSNPFIGKKNEVTHVEEYFLQTICTDDRLMRVLSAYVKSHPYEEPAFYYWKINTSY